MIPEIDKVGVVGCGTMGAGMCEVFSRGGLSVVFCEVSKEAAEQGHQRIARSVEYGVKSGKLTQVQGEAMRSRISSTTRLEDLADCDLVVEAVPERIDLKKQILTTLDGLVSPEAVLATNTSSLPVIDLAVATKRPTRVIGLHFFNPAPMMRLVELVHTVATDMAVVEEIREFVEGLGKEAVVTRDRPGFVVNRLLFPYLNSAVRLLDQGYAAREDIDAAMTLGCRHPLGPLALLDLIGLDSAYEICDVLWREFGEHVEPPASLLRQYRVAGYLGRKTARGFYRYEAPGSSQILDFHKNGSRERSSGVSTVGVVGTGLMASGITQVAAEAGNRVLLWGRSNRSLDKARASISKSLERKAAKKKLEPSWVEQVIGRIEPTGTLGHLAEADLVVEAVAEDLELKKRVFRELDLSVKPSSVIATTTSSLPIVELAAETDYPGRIVGVHFFNPAPLMKLVEVVSTVASEEEVEERAAAWVRELGKEPVRCSDRPGFIVNFLLFPYLNDAVRMVEAGYGTPAEIDNAVKLGCGHPMGPFELMDIVGLDVTQAVLESLHREFREPRYAPASLLGHMVLAGLLGHKAGRGFYAH